MNRALFLDRDGVINEDYGYVHKIKDFHFRDGIFDICKAAQKAHMKIVIVTNQAGIGRGLYTHEDHRILMGYLASCMSSCSITIDAHYYCPYHETAGVGHYRQASCDRKPGSGMIIKACNALNINPFLSLMIGDKSSDLIAAQRAGIRAFIDASRPDWIECSLQAIAG
jgi:D-glycero-D-manno-heptose 1,7-bisphosphate phosphatase